MISDVLVTGNHEGGIRITNSSDPILTDITITGNLDVVEGGGKKDENN